MGYDGAMEAVKTGTRNGMATTASTLGSDNVFADVGFPPAQAERLLARVDLSVAVERWFTKSGLTQSAAAKLVGVTQPRFNQLLKGKTEIFSIDALVTMLARAGMSVRMTVRKVA